MSPRQKHRRRRPVGTGLIRSERLEARNLLTPGMNFALYEFTNHDTATPELFSTDQHAQTTASDISSPLSLGSTGNGNPPRGLALGGAFNESSEPTPAGGQDDYFEFSIVPDAGYEMTIARFSMQVRKNDPDSKDSYSVYFDEVPGGGGNNFSTKLLSAKITSEDTFETLAVDLEGLAELTDVSTPVTFRIYSWGTVGLGTARLDNIRVQGIQETVDGSALAYYGIADRLLHPLDDLGNRIPDFSTAGFRNSNESIPDVAALIDPSRIITVAPGIGDDMATIQAAIDQVEAMSPDVSGFRGIVQLSAGEFQISDQIMILESGVVLLGVGDGDDPASNTILRATGTTQRSIVVVGPSSGFASTLANTTHNIVDKYVPVGATSFNVDSTTNWSVGDAVIVDRPSPANWIADIGMDMIPPRADGLPITQWAAGAFDQLYERVITRIEGNRIFLNAPLMNAIDQQYGGGTVWRYTFPRIRNVGVESVRGVSDFVGPEDEDHASTFIELQAVEDAWVTNVTGQYLVYATVHATSRSIRVTVDDAQSLDPVSIITGGRRYPFTIDGQFVLMKNLYSENGRHDFVNNAANRNRGPNVFLNGTAVNSNSSTGPHQRWSTGTLYDTISTDNLIEARNRGNFGSGHGWAGANMVFWNPTASSFIVQNPPTAQNWIIGGTGPVQNETTFGPQPPPTVDAHETPIDFGRSDNPSSSLYVAQNIQRRSGASTDRRSYVIGDFDRVQFDGNGSADDVIVPSEWENAVTALANGVPLQSFDQGATDQFVAGSFSYSLSANESVTAAVLTLGIRGTGADTTNDQIWLDDTAVGRTLSSLGLDATLPTDQTIPLQIELVDADLALLQDGLLNFAVGEHVIVDWAELDLATINASGPLDFDGDGQSDAATDGILAIRYLFGFRGDALTSGAVGETATNTTAVEIEAALDNSLAVLDADGNGVRDAATDGILIIRYLFGFRDTPLVAGAIGAGATRTTGADVAAFLDGFLPPPPLPPAPPAAGTTRVAATQFAASSPSVSAPPLPAAEPEKSLTLVVNSPGEAMPFISSSVTQRQNLFERADDPENVPRYIPEEEFESVDLQFAEIRNWLDVV